MTAEEIRAVLLRALGRVAPEVDLTSLRGDLPLRTQVDIDSIDFLNFVIELHRELGVDVPEAEYAALATIDSAVTYLQGHASSKA
ncbi:MAG TPA: acyl carrier protein [Gemmatimonadaceae bacterium]|jgi:acyl carrier protein